MLHVCTGSKIPKIPKIYRDYGCSISEDLKRLQVLHVCVTATVLMEHV